MAGPGGVFHVEFGINETQLTRTLERKDYTAAEKIILDNNNTSYLDEGCYQRIPLYIMLCGYDQEERPAPRHFFLAKQLIEHGANVNLRIPTTLFGSEYMGPGKTPLELLVDFFNDLTKHECHMDPLDPDMSVWYGYNPIQQQVLGMDKQYITRHEDVLEQIADLVFITLSNGGDSNVIDEFRMTPLHRTVIYSKDIKLTELLVESGANLNAVDIRGNTPLAAMCDAFPFGIQQFLEDRPVGDPYMECCHLRDKGEFLEYFLNRKDVKLDIQNKCGRTALFNCMVRGDFHSAWSLLRHGADPTLRGQVWGERKRVKEVSPLFASLCSLKVIPRHADRYALYMPQEYQFLAHLIDSGYFTKSQITSELFQFIDDEFPDLMHLKVFGTELIHLLFGGTTTNLRQLCTRTLYQKCLLSNSRSQPSIATQQLVSAYFTAVQDPDFEQTVVTCEPDLTMTLNSSMLDSLLDQLGLPKDTLVYLEIELLRHKLCSNFKMLQWFKYYDEEIDGVLGYYSDSDEFPSDEDDSDLEYW